MKMNELLDRAVELSAQTIELYSNEDNDALGFIGTSGYEKRVQIRNARDLGYDFQTEKDEDSVTHFFWYKDVKFFSWHKAK